MTFIVHASMYNIVLNMVGQIESNTIICPACQALYAAVLEYDYISAKYSWNSSSTDYSYNKVNSIFELQTKLKVWQLMILQNLKGNILCNFVREVYEISKEKLLELKRFILVKVFSSNVQSAFPFDISYTSL